MTNEELNKALRQNQFEHFYDVKKIIEEMLKYGNDLSKENEHLIVIKFNLLSVKEIYNEINHKVNEHNNNNILINNINENYDNLIYNLNDTFSNFKKGFGTILFTNIIVVLTAIISSIIISSNNNLGDTLTISKVVLFIYIISYIIFLFGIIKLYNSSQLKK